MGEHTRTTFDGQTDVKTNPAASSSSTGQPEERDIHAQDPGNAYAQGEPKNAEPAWQGVPL